VDCHVACGSYYASLRAAPIGDGRNDGCAPRRRLSPFGASRHCRTARKDNGGLVAVRLCIEANCSRKAKQRTVLFGEYLARPFKCFALKQDSKGAAYSRAAIVAPGYVSL